MFCDRAVLTFWCNDWKFANFKKFESGSAAQMQGRFWRVEVLENVAADKEPPQCWKTLFRRWSKTQPHDSARLLSFLVVR